MGDFNAHVGFLGTQEIDSNGKALMKFVEKWGLVILNCDDRCMGEVTWKCRGQESVVDFILVSTCLHDYFVSMNIDEDKLKYNLPDHCLLTLTMDVSLPQSSLKQDEDSHYYAFKNDKKMR